MDGDVTPDVVRVRAGTTANKRRSWHVARVAADIQRSLAEQSPARQPRFSWHPNDDCSLSYQQGSGWATTSDSDGKSDQVAQPRASFSIASWADRPVAKEMDSIIANYSSTPGVQREDSSFDEDDSPNDLVQPVFIVPIVLSTTEPPDVQVLNHNKRLNSTMSDNYIDVVVKELRGATPCGFLSVYPNSMIPPPPYRHPLTIFRMLMRGLYFKQMNVRVYKRRRSKNGSIPISCESGTA